MEIQLYTENETSLSEIFSGKTKCGQTFTYTLTKGFVFNVVSVNFDERNNVKGFVFNVVSVNFDELHQKQWQQHCPDIQKSFFDETWILHNKCTSETKTLSVMQSAKNLLAEGKYDEVKRYFCDKTNRKRFIQMPHDCVRYPEKYLLPGDVLRLDNALEAVYMGKKQIAWIKNNTINSGSFPSSVGVVSVMTCRIRYLSPIELLFMASKLLNLNKAQTYQIINNFQLFQQLCAQGHGRLVTNSDTAAKLPSSSNVPSLACSLVVRGGVTLKSWSVPVNAVNNVANPIKHINVSYAAAVVAATGKEIPLSDLMVLAGKVSDALSSVSWIVLPTAIIIDICRLCYSLKQDLTNENGDKKPRKFVLTAASIAGGWGGGFAGGWAGNASGMAIGALIGSLFGGAGAIPGAFFGGIVGSIVCAIAGSIAASYAARKLAILGTEYAFGYMHEPNVLKRELIEPRNQILYIWQTSRDFKIYYIDIDSKKKEYVNIPIHTSLEEYLTGLTNADKEGFDSVVYAGYDNQHIFNLINETFKDPIGKTIVPNYILFAAAMISTSNLKVKEGQIIQIVGLSDDEIFTVVIKLNATGFDILNINQILDGPSSSYLPLSTKPDKVQSGLIIAVRMELTPKTEKLMEDLVNDNHSANTYLITIQKECAECMAELITKTRDKLMERYKPNLDALHFSIET